MSTAGFTCFREVTSKTFTSYLAKRSPGNGYPRVRNFARPPSFGDDCHLKEWPSAVDGILGLVTEHTVIVPGHGRPMDRLAGFTQRAEISGLYGQVEYLVGRGVKLTEAYEAGEWPFDEATVRAVLPLAYAQLAAEGKVPRPQLPLA